MEEEEMSERVPPLVGPGECEPTTKSPLTLWEVRPMNLSGVTNDFTQISGFAIELGPTAMQW
jgi:hypothetical protein